MSRIKVLTVYLILTLSYQVSANGGDYGSRDEAISMVRRLQDMYRKIGPEGTFKAVNDKGNREFHVRDLYVFVLDPAGVSVAHGFNQDYVGHSLYDLRDQDGKYHVREIMEVCKSAGHGWVEFRWVNPITRKVEGKLAYVERLGDLCAGVGVYKPDQLNENTITIMAGRSGDSDLQIANDLSTVLDEGDDLRVIPMVGKGGAQAIRDVIGLRGVDVGITHINILNYYRRQRIESKAIDDSNKLVYIAPLFTEEVHLIVRSDINSINQLRGQRVNIGEVGSGTYFAMQDIFRQLGIRIDEIAVGQPEAAGRLSTGEIAAAALVAGRPAAVMHTYRSEMGFHLIDIPYVKPLREDYLPTYLTHEDYPNLIDEGRRIETLAISSVLIAYNWPKGTDRYSRLSRFVDSLFSKFAELHKSAYHVKWGEVNLNSTLPNWPRFERAESWVRLLGGRGAARQDIEQIINDQTSTQERSDSEAR